MRFHYPASMTIMFALTVGLVSCKPAAVSPKQQPIAKDKALEIVTTVIPMTQFTKAVVGDRGQVEQLVSPSSGIHHYTGTPQEVQMLANADVLVKNGLDMESFLDELITNANNPNLTVINTSEGISKRKWDDIGSTRSLEFQDEQSQSHQQDHSNHQADANYDPHIWLDPKRAIQQVKNIRDSLTEIDPQGKAIYRKNAQAYIEKLKQLDQEISKKLSPYQGETFVVFHDFANYFADSYNLSSQPLVEIPVQKPSPQDVQQVMETVEQNNIQAILTEPQAEGAFEVLSQDLGVSVRHFHPLATGDANLLQPEDYLTTMRQNAEHVVTALESSEDEQTTETNDGNSDVSKSRSF